VIGDLGGSLPIENANLDMVMPDMIDMELFREHMKVDEAFVEALQESLRPLYVLSYIPDFLLILFLVLGSGAMSEPGDTVSLNFTRARDPSLMAWQMPTSVGGTRTTFAQTPPTRCKTQFFASRNCGEKC
jgi:hypothetical protein